MAFGLVECWMNGQRVIRSNKKFDSYIKSNKTKYKNILEK